MAELQSKFQDDAEFPCCCCERLCRRAAVSCVDFSNVTKYQTASWLALKGCILKNSGTEQLYICKYWQPFLNKNTMPARCVLNGLFTEPVLPLVHITESVILHPKRKSSTKHSTGTKKNKKLLALS